MKKESTTVDPVNYFNFETSTTHAYIGVSEDLMLEDFSTLTPQQQSKIGIVLLRDNIDELKSIIKPIYKHSTRLKSVILQKHELLQKNKVIIREILNQHAIYIQE
ncbi:MAG: hypothetical protein ABJH04_07845 [Cyclobacteriaceae bacterium]